MPALQPPTKKIGTVWYVKDESGKPARRWPSGRVRYRGKVTWPDGKRQDVAVPEAHCRTDDTANEHIKGLQEQLTKTGTLALAQALAKVAPPPVDPKLAEDWFTAWLADRKRRGLTSWKENQAHYNEHIRPIIPGQIRDWSADDMRALSRALDAKVQAGAMKWKTAWNVWGTAHRMCRDSCMSKHDDIRVRVDNPVANVAGPDRGEKTSKQYLYPSEFSAFLAFEEVPLAWRRAVALAVCLFPRAGELRALRWEDVDLEHGTVHIHRARNREDIVDKGTKTKAARRFAIEPVILPLLRAMHEESGGEGHVIALPNDKHLARDFRQWLGEAEVGRAELHVSTPTRKAMTFHDLRATGLTWLAVRGDDPLKIMQRAGHSDFATTQGYIREAEAVRAGFGDVFPALPKALLCLHKVSTGGPSGGNDGGGAGNRTRVRKFRGQLRLRAYPAVYLIPICAGRRALLGTSHLLVLAAAPVTRALEQPVC